MRGVSSSARQDDWVTLATVGALVTVVGSVAHEIMGHGLGCALDGGTITLVTFLVFRCDGAGWAADGGGPVGALLIGCLGLLFLHRSGARSPLFRLVLFTAASMLLFWFFAQMVEEAIDGRDDWGHVARDLHWSKAWHLAAAAVGVAGYALTLRLLKGVVGGVVQGRRTRLLVPYLGAALSAPIFGALWHGAPLASAFDGFLTFAVAPFGHLLLLSSVERKDPASEPIVRSHTFVGSTLAAIVVFAVVVAPGMGRLS
jgi:hypothetical protein